jgi:hypothetical protein
MILFVLVFIHAFDFAIGLLLSLRLLGKSERRGNYPQMTQIYADNPMA